MAKARQILRNFRTLGPALALMAATLSPGVAAEAGEPQRIVSIGGSVTEIITRLGQRHRLIARDTTSTFPPEIAELPDVGYIRALSPEGVLSVNPDLIVALEGSGPPEALAVLKQAKVPLVEIPEGFDRRAISRKIRAIAHALGADEAGEKLAAEVEAKLRAAEAVAAKVKDRRKVLFILSMRGGRALAAGAHTHADAIIGLAGAQNALKGVEGYKQITDEAVIESGAQIILMMDRGGNHEILDDALFKHPAIALTPAGRSRSVIRMNGLYLLGFGPRTAAAALDLNRAIYGREGASGK